MRKISKAAAALTAGCMLLSTSAFAAIEDNIDGKALLVNGEYTVNLDYTTAGQSTIIVLTEGTKLADANESNILYINQAAIADGKATYAINLGTSFAGNAVVYAGGTAETATELGTLTTIKDVEDLTLTADVNELEFGQTATLTATVIPEDATNKTVEWTGNVTDVVTVGNVTTAKFVAPEVSEDTDFVITAKVGDFTESVTIKVKAKVVVPETPAGDYFAAAGETGKAKVSTARAFVGWTGFAAGGKKAKVVLDATAYPDVEGSEYMIKVVYAPAESDSANADKLEKEVEGVEYFYHAPTSAEISKGYTDDFFVVLIPAEAVSIGYKFEVVSGAEANVASEIAEFGENNGRAGINISDANRLAQIVKGKVTKPEDNLTLVGLDVTSDGQINISDANQLAQMVKGKTDLTVIK